MFRDRQWGKKGKEKDACVRAFGTEINASSDIPNGKSLAKSKISVIFLFACCINY
jgi:hypothetical protein